MTMHSDLNPADFADTAQAVMESCRREAAFDGRAALLAESGLLGVLAPETAGGMDLPPAFAVPVLEAAGANLLEYPLAEALLLSQAFGESAEALVAAIVDGTIRPTIAWSGELAAQRGHLARAPFALEASHVLAFQQDGSAILFEAGSRGVKAEAADTLDVTCPEASLVLREAVEGVVLPVDQVAGLRQTGLLLRAALILGHAGECLGLARDYADQREQFGRTLSSNQAIRHRLARQSLSVETIRNAIARALSAGCEDRELAVWSAFLGACDLGATVAEGAIQIHGSMGFTWDVPLHRHLRRIKALAAQGQAAHVADLVAGRLTGTREGGMRHAG